MKKLKIYILFIVFVLSVKNSFAQTGYGTINKFEILPEYLVNGKVKLSTGNTTTIKFNVTIARTNLTTYPTVTWKPVQMIINLSSFDNSGTPFLFAGTHNITSADFTDPNSAFVDLTLTTVIDNSKLITGGKILLAFKSPDIPNNNLAAYPKEYGYDKNVTVPQDPTEIRVNPFWETWVVNSPFTTYPGNTPIWYPSGIPFLTSGQEVFTANGAYRFTLQTDGNLVLYRTSNNQVLWATNTHGKGGRYLMFQNDGNLVLYKNSDYTGVVWASGYSAPSSIYTKYCRFVFQDDGNLVFQFVHLKYVQINGETQTYNRTSSHSGKFK
nr:hypothetical protein [Pedobacter panaciterrae]